jgi:hypothetical protein
MNAYNRGLDILGDGVGDFVPWLGIVGKLVGGSSGGADDAAKKALAAQQAAALAKAQHDAAVTKIVLFSVLGVAVLGTGAVLLLRK